MMGTDDNVLLRKMLYILFKLRTEQTHSQLINASDDECE